MLEVMRDHFKISPGRMLIEIQAMRAELDRILNAKGISYEGLKTALVPDRKRREIALIFDCMAIEDGWYGNAVFKKLLPLLDPEGNHSILAGDYLGQNKDQDARYEAMRDAVRLNRSVTYKHSSQFFIVYINNLTQTMIDRIENGLRDWEGFVGFADTTYGSLFKYLLSTMLANVCIKHGRIIIQGHEDDRPETDDINMVGYPFEGFGYRCRSVPGYLESVLLSYKIERPVLKGFEVDTEFSLNAVSATPFPLESFTIEVENAKLAYLKSAKAGSLARAGLEALNSEQLSERIRERISSNYIYNMAHDEEHSVTKFNVILELSSPRAETTRLLAALQYKAEDRILRLITLY